jgi:CBS domain-containing protein
MQLREVMTRNVETVRPDASLEEAARKMDDLNVGPLPVCDGDRLVGLVTDRDITVRATAAGKDPRSTPIREAMSQDLVYCYEDQDVQDAAQLMQDKQIRRVPVLNRQQRMVGIVSLGDIAAEGRDDRMSGETLGRVSEPSNPDR